MTKFDNFLIERSERKLRKVALLLRQLDCFARTHGNRQTIDFSVCL